MAHLDSSAVVRHMNGVGNLGNIYSKNFVDFKAWINEMKSQLQTGRKITMQMRKEFMRRLMEYENQLYKAELDAQNKSIWFAVGNYKNYNAPTTLI